MQAPAPNPFHVHSYGCVILFDFFLPVSQAYPLRKGLDGLFEQAAVERRLRALSASGLARAFGEPAGSPEAGIREAVEWISKTFRGYSISHVSGRFRSDAPSKNQPGSRTEAVVDETTAVVRFVFPIGKSVESRRPDEGSLERMLGSSSEDFLRDEADRVRRAFYALFVEPVVRLCDGEEEIWLLESGYVHRLHKWIRKGAL
jgi:hypothetical protein